GPRRTPARVLPVEAPAAHPRQLRVDLIVHSRGGVVVDLRLRLDPRQVVGPQAVRRRRAERARRRFLGENRRDERILRGRETVRRGDVEQVDGALLTGSGLIAEDALLGLLREDGVGARLRQRVVLLFEVDEDEQLVAPLAARHDRAAEVEAEIVAAELGLRQTARRVEVGIGVELIALRLVEGAAVVLARAAARLELQVDSAVDAGIAAEAG